MKLLQAGLFALLVLAGITTAKAQTVDEIIDKNIAAIGGKDILSKINSISIEGTANAMGNDYPTSITILNGKGFKTVTSVNGMDIINCMTDTSGWMLNPMMGQSEPTALPAEAIKAGKASLDVCGELYNYKDKGFTATLEGKEKYEAVDAYKIKLTNAAQTITYFIDPNTFYILRRDVKASIAGKDMTNTTTFSNYKKTDFGYVMAFTLGVNNMGYDVAVNYTKVDVNKDVDPKIFAMPK
ncbi:MAG: hypothetical protein JST87_14110 [Bacteroidetes bacterium]|nr:hypothetical protein [Bacteroidota bacterium]